MNAFGVIKPVSVITPYDRYHSHYDRECDNLAAGPALPEQASFAALRETDVVDRRRQAPHREPRKRFAMKNKIWKRGVHI